MTDLQPQSTAVVLIDLQHGILARDLAPHPAAHVVSNAARLTAAWRAAGATIVYVRVALGEIHTHAVDRPRARPDSFPPNACDILPEAGMREGDFLVTKRQWGAFHATELDQILRRRGIRTIILGGVATNIGVETTARAAHDLGYDIVFAEDATSTLTADMHRFAFEQMFPTMGRVRSTDQLLAALPA